MSSLQQLREEHACLIDIVGRLEELLAGRTAPPSLALFALRSELSRALIGHLKAEAWVLYPRLLRSAETDVAATARAFVEEMGGLAAAYAGHTAKWSANAIEHDWLGYRRESTMLVEALKTRIARENVELYPLLDRSRRAA